MGVLFLETMSKPLCALHELVHASHDTTLLSLGKGFGREVIHAVIKTSLNEIGVCLDARSASEDSHLGPVIANLVAIAGV